MLTGPTHGDQYKNSPVLSGLAQNSVKKRDGDGGKHTADLLVQGSRKVSINEPGLHPALEGNWGHFSVVLCCKEPLAEFPRAGQWTLLCLGKGTSHGD